MVQPWAEGALQDIGQFHISECCAAQFTMFPFVLLRFALVVRTQTCTAMHAVL
jgi:hypothetical protein